MLETSLKEKIERWTGPEFDAETVAEVKQQLAQAESDDAVAQDLKERFLNDLKFGTGGMRALMGLGSDRMNIYTIRKAAQGVASYFTKAGVENPKAAISYDSRNNSQLFAREISQVFAANGIQTFLFAESRPTPMLSFATRHLGCVVGGMVTASHNPKEYNGFKVFAGNGAQVMGQEADDIVAIVRSTDYSDIKTEAFADAKAAGKIQLLGVEFDTGYLDVIRKARLSADLAEKHASDVKIVFTNIHGTGGSIAPQALKDWGFSNVSLVAEQQQPDGNFPTVHSPNPEEQAALDMAIQQATNEDADLVIGTDPDADRIGIAVKALAGGYRLMSGQEVAALMTYYVLERRKETDNLPDNAAVIKTIVTTDLIPAICDAYGVECVETLTGFKYIGALINAWDDEGRRQDNPDKTYVFGGEESYGYLLGTHARDKDAVVLCCGIAEMLVWSRAKGMSLEQLLQEIHQKFGVFAEDQLALKLEGLEGQAIIAEVMASLRSDPPRAMQGEELSLVRDVQSGKVLNGSLSETGTLDFPNENVLELSYGNALKFTARPSGTEPKVKFYLVARDTDNLPISSDDIIARTTGTREKLSEIKSELHEEILRRIDAAKGKS